MKAWSTGAKKKRKKYAKLKRWVAHGLNLHILSLAVSSRRFVLANSFNELFDSLGIESSKKKTFRNALSKIALGCSYVVWINRFNKKRYKRPLIRCNFGFKYLFSKFIKEPTKDVLENPILANQASVSSRVVPGTNIQYCKVGSAVDTGVDISK